MNGELGSGTPALARSPGFIWGRAPSALVTVGKGESHHFQERESGWSGFAIFWLLSHTAPAGLWCHKGEPGSWLDLQTPGFDKAKSGWSPLPSRVP